MLDLGKLVERATGALSKLTGTKFGVVALLAGAAVTVGVGAAAHDSTQVQALAHAALPVCVAGLGGAIGFVIGRIGKEPPLPPPPAVVVS